MKLLSGITYTLVAASIFGAAVPVSAQHKDNQGASEFVPNEQVPDLKGLPEAISELMKQHHFDPSVETDPAYILIQKRVAELAKTASTRSDFASGFNKIWREGPFSHVRLSIAKSSAQKLADHFDTIRIGGGGAILQWDNDVAILTVKTMMGLDTIEEIDTAFDEIVAQHARALIVDLRQNEGGAFAIKPLLAHVLKEPVDAGVFVSRRWTGQHDRYPKIEEVKLINPWQGWSIKAFWNDLQTEEMIRMQLTPSRPTFDGPVYVLISKETASAAELAADAFAVSGRAILIGEKTAGEMLSQTFFDLPQGFQLALPVGDYYAFHSGRIEGKGVQPDIVTNASEAMLVAKKLIAH